MSPHSETVTLIAPIRELINLNAERSMHYHRRAKLVRAIRTETRALAAAMHHHTGPVNITARFRWPTHHRRDSSNYLPTIKAAVDGLVDAGILTDDNDTHVHSLTIAGDVPGGITPGYVAIELTIQDVNP